MNKVIKDLMNLGRMIRGSEGLDYIMEALKLKLEQKNEQPDK